MVSTPIHKSSKKPPSCPPKLYWHEWSRQIAGRAAALRATAVVRWIRTRRGLDQPPDESMLFEALHVCAYRAGERRGCRLSHSRRRQWARDWQLVRSHILEENIGLVYSMLARFNGPNLDSDELRSEGLFAILRAIDRFRPSRGCKFSTYCCNVVARAMARVCRRAMNQRRLLTNVDTQLFNPPPPPFDRHTDVAIDRLMRALKENRAELTGLESSILASRFAENPKETLSFREIGEQVGLSKERVRQIQNAALDKLRRVLEEDLVLQ